MNVDCAQNGTQLIDVIFALAQDIVPNVALEIQQLPNCQVGILAEDPPNMIAIIVGAILGGLLFLALIIFILYAFIFKKSLVGKLPEDVAWSFKLYEQKPFGWDYHGTRATGYYSKELQVDSPHYNRAIQLFNTMGRNSYEISNVIAVYNPLLIRNFVGSYLIQTDRSKHDANLFSQKKWAIGSNHIDSQFVYEHYVKTSQKHEWNQESGKPHILLACHGTDQFVAERICQTGFATLSSVDAGYFGKGIYFTSYSMYCLPYIACKRAPTIILSWILPGNPYPVTEHHEGAESLMGTATKSGFNSHYVVTDKKGQATTKPTQSELFNEIVINQEAQIVPAFILCITPASLSAVASLWSRDIPINTNKTISTTTTELAVSLENHP